MNVVIITGASSGMGAEFAYQMDPYFTNIDQFWLIGRSQSKLDEIAACLEYHPTMILNMDLTDEASLDELASELRSRNATVRMLINCAGYGIMGSFADNKKEEELGMIRINCEALTSITHRLLPFMKKGSRIIQLASAAAFLPQPDFAVYAATKAYVLNFSLALGEELRSRGIYVTSVCPGPVNTPFFEIALKGKQLAPMKRLALAEPEYVVAKALRDSYKKQSISVYGLPMKGFRILTKCVPHSLILKALSKIGSTD